MKKEDLNLSKYMRLVLSTILLLILLIPIFSGTVSAQNDMSMDMQTLEAGETYEGPGFFSGDTIQIDGTVEGTTFASGREVSIEGTINGSLFIAAQTVIVNGEVTGNVYAAGQNVTINGNTEGDAFLAGQNIRIGENAQMGRDLFTAGATIIQEGSVPRHVFSGAQTYILNGQVGGDVMMALEQLTIQESAEVEGDLLYRSSSEATIDSNAVINGQTDWTQVTGEVMQETQSPTRQVMDVFLGMLWSIVGALLVWFLFKFLRDNFWMNMVPLISASPFKTIGIGFLTLFLVPIVIILLLILAVVTVAGIPLALILAALYGIGLYISHIVVAVSIGSWLADRLTWIRLKREVWLVLLGLVLLELIGIIPVANFIVSLVVIVIGLGALAQAPFKRTDTVRS